jgi:5-methylcytosine-specific restriction enzyme subunit McrC
VTVLTRIPIANLYYLLCYAWNRLEEDEVIDVRNLEAGDPINLLSQLLVATTRQALRRGLNRDYFARQSELACVRGRLLYAESRRRLLLEHGRVACEFDELDHNNLPNRILRTSLLNLREAETISDVNREAVMGLLRELKAIQPIELHAGIFRRVRLHRSNAHYGLILSICEMAFDCLMPESGSGPHRFRSFVEDHTLMAGIYQDFIHNFYVAHAPEHGFTRVNAPSVKWAAVPKGEASRALLPSMLTDVVLQGPGRQIIIDCKFYHEALSRRFNGEKLNSSNLYQIFAYVKNQSRQLGWASCEGLLLYPSMLGDFEAEYEMDGNRIRAATVDLSRPWSCIRDRLLQLIVT